MVADPTLLKDSGTPIKVIYSMPNMGSHNGSTVAFGPDGFLYWAKGQDHGQMGAARRCFYLLTFFPHWWNDWLPLSRKAELD